MELISQQQPWALDLTRISPTSAAVAVISPETAQELLNQQQETTKTIAERLIRDQVLQQAIQAWRHDLLTSQTELKGILTPAVKQKLPQLPIVEKARAAHLELRHNGFSWTRRISAALQILLPLVALGYTSYATWAYLPTFTAAARTAKEFSLGSSTPGPYIPKSLASMCPQGFFPSPKALDHTLLLKPTTAPRIQDFTCKQLSCPMGSMLSGTSCIAVTCQDSTQLFDSAWGFCVPKERTVPGVLWGKSECSNSITWMSILDLACWSSYMRLFIPWLLQSVQSTVFSFTKLFITLSATSLVALVALAALRCSFRATAATYSTWRTARRLAAFIQTVESLAITTFHFRLTQAITPHLFKHLDTLQNMPPVSRAVAVAEFGFVERNLEQSPTQLLYPLFLKCIQDVLARIPERAVLTLVETDIVESKQFQALTLWIEDSSRELRDELGRLRAQHGLRSFQEDVRSAISLLL
jgi:hypothetical protein